MGRLITKLSDFLSPGPAEDERFQFFKVGFHGDSYLLDLAELIMNRCGFFIETGANVGSTLAYVAKTFPHVSCFSCEPDKMAYSHAQTHTARFDNVRLFNETSQTFLRRLINKEELLNGDVIFWIDAHGYGFQWPLLDEIEIITSHWKKAFLIIDDFLVPGLDCFEYDSYSGQICSLDYIKSSLSATHEYKLYYPTYTDRTSKHHPLRGWGLLEFGHAGKLDLPEHLRSRIRKEHVIG